MLRLIFPDAQIDIWTKSRNLGIVKNNPVFNEILVFDNIKTADYNEVNKIDFWPKLSFLKRIRKQKYDLYIDLTGKYSTALIAALGNFRYSAGINYHGFGFCYNKFYELDTATAAGHLIDKYMSIARNIFSIGDSEWRGLLTQVRNRPYLYTDNRSVDLAEEERRRLQIKKPLVCVHLTAGWKAKELPSRIFATLFEELLSEDRIDLLIIGTESDKQKLAEIQSNMRNSFDLEKRFVVLPIKATIELIRSADLLIGSDSAPLHIAGAVDTPSIALFGPTNPEFSRPRGEKHMVVYHRLYCSASDSEQFCTRNAGKSCPTIDCMNNIQTSEIMDKVYILLNIPKSRETGGESDRN